MLSFIIAVIRDVLAGRAPRTLEYLESEEGKELLASIKSKMGFFGKLFASPQARLLAMIEQRVRSEPGVPAALAKAADEVKEQMGNAISSHGFTTPLYAGDCHLTTRALARSSVNGPMTSRLKKIGGIEDAFKDLPPGFKLAFYADLGSKLEDGVFAQALKNRKERLGPVWVLGADNNPNATWGDAGTGCYYWSRKDLDPSQYKQLRRNIEELAATMGQGGRKAWAEKQNGYPWKP
jgi:hypothetical protein